MESLKAQLLIASRRLMDPNFLQTVVLIVQHGDEGALGLVLNRPLDITVSQACKEALEGATCAVDGVLHQGGPCQGPLMVLHTHESQADAEVMEGVHFSTERDKIEWLLNNAESTIKFFVGYAGWGPGQLEEEIESGSWLVAEADARHIFDATETQWTRLTTRATLGQWIDPARIPEDPSLN